MQQDIPQAETLRPVSKALYGAAENGDVQLISGLVMTQNGNEALLPHGITCLHIVACSPDTTALGALLDTDPDLEAQPIMAIRLYMQLHMLKLDAISALLCKGAHIEAQTHPGSTPLHVAARNNQHKAVMMLADAGQCWARTRFGTTALHTAAVNGHLDAFAALLEAGADIHAENHYGYGCLHHAAWRNRSEMIPALMEAGAVLNARTHDGQTPLHIAADAGHTETITSLLDAGADAGLTDYHHRAIDLADIQNRKKLDILAAI